MDIIYHPDWKSYDIKYDADIAVVVLDKTISFGNAIQPVCLPPKTFEEVSGVGMVVGWGKSENSDAKFHDSRPNKILVPAINSSHCYTTFPKLAEISSIRSFCGGYDQLGIAPCHGDSGGGFYLRNNAAWMVQGIVSSTILDKDGCDVNVFSIYTNVAQFVEWIEEVVDRTYETIYEFLTFQCNPRP